LNKTSLLKIEEEVASLPSSEQLRFLERLIHRMRKPPCKPASSWDALYGIGKGVWHQQDAQEYVNQMREDRL
jgi:hypothetical protein